MALTVLHRVHVLKKVAVPFLFSPAILNAGEHHVCIPSIWTSPVCHQLLRGRSPSELGRRWLCITSREPLFLVSGSIRLSRDPSVAGRPTSLLHRLSSDEDRVFKDRLSSCTSSRQVLRLLRSSPHLSGAAAASVLHQLADLEQNGTGGLRDPDTLLSDVALSELCSRLEKESAELEDEAVIQALQGCTRLYLDPWSHLVVRLVSESQVRLDRGCLSIGALCSLARALFVLEGPNCAMLAQAISQLQNKDPAHWDTSQLTAVYSMLASGLAEGGRYQDLLNEMNARALSLAPKMDPLTVSETFGALVTLSQAQALPLVIALCKQAVRHVPNFADAELAMVLSALMHYGHSDHFLVKELERHVPKTAFTTHPETVTKVMQYFGRRRIFSPPVFDAVAESFVYRADEYATGQVSRQIAALGVVGYVPQEAGRLFRKVESVLSARFSQFQPRALLELLHACTLLQRYPLNFVSKVFSPYFLQQLQEESSGMDRVMLAQLTQLYMTVKLECPFYDGPRLLPKLRVKSFLFPGRSLETPVDPHLYNTVKTGLVDLLGARSYFASRVLTPYCYTLDVEIKLDEEGYVLPASHDEVYKRIALCIDGPKRFAANARQLLGKEAIKQRHLQILGYEVVQIPYYEFEKLKGKAETVEYLHKKIFPHSYRLSW
ncbi:FAST kinase domain-containing protein 3, mitochondrial isoform X1 [Pygocentrus nattereri]|uniref:RAP domain-containing protein n=1 Tax=Pygocentrus nattereri TaxID=42514 RepID=A0A3B4EAY2_PYGNA|nr:FAST kinase domain-containing protein 3, mitochondrial isoform X1 [Pygocentrus nattereri]